MEEKEIRKEELEEVILTEEQEKEFSNGKGDETEVLEVETNE